MIPVTSINNAGELSYQVFNDNLTPVEQINRKILCTLLYAQSALTNDKNEFDVNVGKVAYDDAKIAAINTAATTLVTAVKTAIETFEATL